MLPGTMVLSFTRPTPFKSFLVLRQYPFRFGLRVLRILPRILEDAAKMPPSPPVNFDGLDVFNQDWSIDDIWEDAHLDDVILYLRGNASLRLPSDYRDAFKASFTSALANPVDFSH